MTEKKEVKPDIDPRPTYYQGVMFGIATFGKFSSSFFVSQATMQMPIFTNVGYHLVQGKPVDVARNEIAHTAMKANQAYVFFRDDDTIAPGDALMKLMKRLPLDQRRDPYHKGNMVVGGVVYTKTKPPVPMIHMEGMTGGFEDWEYGELVECDIIGMGCTLVPLNVFRKVLPLVKYWQCCNQQCHTRWDVDYEKEGNCPTCGMELIPVMFKTIRDYDDDGNRCVMTEDSYFLLKAKKAGVKVYADCGVQCEHEEFNVDHMLSTYYYYDHNVGLPVWRQGSVMYFWPHIDADKGNVTPIEKTMELRNGKKKPKKGDKVKWNLGAGGVVKKGFLSVDLTVESDFQCDVRNLQPLIQEYGKADEIHASHILEHIGRPEVVPTLRGWIKALKPGGVLNIEVPDGAWAAEQFVNYAKNGGDIDDWPQMVIMGAQRWPGDEHRTLIYEKRMKQMLKLCKGLIKESKVETVFPKTSNQQIVRARIVKK
jgi:predicted SAM-dependent methyltransferase